MKDILKKVLTQAATAAIPAIANILLTKHFHISDLTLDEYVKNVFLANPNSPQCFKLRTRIPPEQVFGTCRALFAGMKAQVNDTEMTKDDWPLMFGNFEEAFFRRPGIDGASRLYVVGALKEGEETTVVVGCRFTGSAKFDLFKWFEKASIKQAMKVVKAIDLHAVPEKITKS